MYRIHKVKSKLIKDEKNARTRQMIDQLGQLIRPQLYDLLEESKDM